MSKPYVPVPRHRFIGVNIRPGFTPGSFSQNFAASKTRITRKQPHPYQRSREIREAATRVLEKRGLINEPNFQDSTISGGYSRR